MSKSHLTLSSSLRKLHPVSLAAETIAYHEHLLMQILVYLPVKSLWKFKSVCRSWNFLICSPHFCHAHFRLNSGDATPISGIFLRRNCIPSSSAYQFLPLSNLSMKFQSLPSPSPVEIPGKLVSVLQFCNGLMLYYSIDISDANVHISDANVHISDANVLNFHVYNPTTNQLRTIPSIEKTFLNAALGFAPCRSSGGYKVISLHSRGMSSHFAIKIYSTETGSWKDWEQNDLQAPFDVALNDLVYWRGAIHWICTSEDSFYFEVDQEKLMRMPSPPVSWMEKGHPKFCECEGKLIYMWHKHKCLILRIYVMENHETGWFLKFTVDLGALRYDHRPFGANTSVLSVLCLVNSRVNDKDGRCILVIHVPGVVLGYDLDDRTTKELCSVPLTEGEVPGKLQFCWFDGYSFTHSLACV